MSWPDTRRVGRSDDDKTAWGDRGKDRPAFWNTGIALALLTHSDPYDKLTLLLYAKALFATAAFFDQSLTLGSALGPSLRPLLSTTDRLLPCEGHQKNPSCLALKTLCQILFFTAPPQRPQEDSGIQSQEQHRYSSAPLNSFAGLEDEKSLQGDEKAEDGITMKSCLGQGERC